MLLVLSRVMEKTSVGKRGEPLAGHLTGVERRGRVWGEGRGGEGETGERGERVGGKGRKRQEGGEK